MAGARRLARSSAAWRLAAVIGLVLACARGGEAQGWRLTGLSAFDLVWQTVESTSHDPSLHGVNWRAVRDELRPLVERAGSAEAQREIVREMLRRLGRSHFALLGAAADAEAPRGPARLPFDVRLTATGQLVVTRLHPDQQTAVRPGDVIVQVDGRDATGLLESGDPTHPYPRERAWREGMRLLSGPDGTPLPLVLRRGGGPPQAVVVSRVVGDGSLVAIGNLPTLQAEFEQGWRQTASGRRVGVLRFNVWMPALADRLETAIDTFREADGLIVDLRGNPGGLIDMMRGVAGHMLDEPVLLGRMRMRDIALEFRANPRRSTSDGRAVRPFAGPVALLVDELTASASECFAGALQAIGRARVFGQVTAGQALPASTLQLPTGDVLLYAVGDFELPDGRSLEGAGVRPDVAVPLTPEALAAGRDAEWAALAWLDQVSLAR